MKDRLRVLMAVLALFGGPWNVASQAFFTTVRPNRVIQFSAIQSLKNDLAMQQYFGVQPRLFHGPMTNTSQKPALPISHGKVLPEI